VDGLRGVLAAAGLDVRVQAYGPRFSLLFGVAQQPRNYADVATADRDTERRFYREALREGVYLHHGWHHGISAVHDDAVLDEALDRLGRAAIRTAEGTS
jgi:glutamate-1-semialdehyde aminotransferase